MNPASTLRTQRTALSLYAVLLVLPTITLGFLQWHHIVQEHESELEQVPAESLAAALRFREELSSRLYELVESENQRGLEQYAQVYMPATSDGEFALVPTSLTKDARPAGVLAWFSFDLVDPRRRDVSVFFGGEQPPAETRERVEGDASELCKRFFDREWLSSSIPIEPDAEDKSLPVAVIAASAATPDDEDCLRAAQMSLNDQVHTVRGDLTLLFYRTDDDRPQLAAYRPVMVQEMQNLVGMSDCVARLRQGRRLVQGFFIDPKWYFETLPRDSAARVLNDKRERLLREGETCCDGPNASHAELRLVGDMGFKTENPHDADYERVRIAIDTAGVEQRYRERLWRFAGVATMLVLALGTGVVLLGRSVQKDLEQAARTENFVAAVTHELRTPLSAIKLHGEMLLEGWAKDPEKQQEYYRRIVRETERLAMLVERVLEKSKLDSKPVEPLAGDVSEEVARHIDKLLGWRTTDQPDLVFELADDLPLVSLTPDGVASMLVNLVENARKYAPVDFSKPGAEPIRIVTRREGRGVVLEVLDRGPGVPEREREKVFEAFYRVGNESTRTTRGTGLGLHLVALQAAAVGGKASVSARPGGGAAFRVVFRPADDSTQA